VGSVYLAEHSHIPVNTDTAYEITGGSVPAIYRRMLDPFVA
jgi:hypothetical protein